MQTNTLYNGGGMTSYPKQLMMKEVKQRVEDMGVEVYDPSSQPFNNKKDMGNSDIATTIVAKDTEAIYNSQMYLMNTQEDNLGTCIEAGIIKGFSDQALITVQVIDKLFSSGKSHADIVSTLYQHSMAQLMKEYIPYHTDIRIHDEPESGFRRSVGFHQFLRGVNLTLGGYHEDYDRDFDGFFSLNDALEILEEVSGEPAPLGSESPLHIEVRPSGSLIAHIKETD